MPEYLAAYESGYLSEDQEFLLMQMIQCIEDEPEKTHLNSVLRLLEENIEIHLSTAWYWSCIGSEMDEAWDIAPAMRDILLSNRALWQ